MNPNVASLRLSGPKEAPTFCPWERARLIDFVVSLELLDVRVKLL